MNKAHDKPQPALASEICIDVGWVLKEGPSALTFDSARLTALRKVLKALSAFAKFFGFGPVAVQFYEESKTRFVLTPRKGRDEESNGPAVVAKWANARDQLIGGIHRSIRGAEEKPASPVGRVIEEAFASPNGPPAEKLIEAARKFVGALASTRNDLYVIDPTSGNKAVEPGSPSRFAAIRDAADDSEELILCTDVLTTATDSGRAYGLTRSGEVLIAEGKDRIAQLHKIAGRGAKLRVRRADKKDCFEFVGVDAPVH